MYFTILPGGKSAGIHTPVPLYRHNTTAREVRIQIILYTSAFTTFTTLRYDTIRIYNIYYNQVQTKM